MITSTTYYDDNDDEKNGLYFNFMLLPPPNPILQISQNSMWCKTTFSPLSW